jgi:hypothetical protein
VADRGRVRRPRHQRCQESRQAAGVRSVDQGSTRRQCDVVMAWPVGRPAAPSRTSQLSSGTCTCRASTCFCTSRASTPRSRRQGAVPDDGRVCRVQAGHSFRSGCAPGWPRRGPRASGSDDPRCRRRWSLPSGMRGRPAKGSWRLPVSSGLESARYGGCWGLARLPEMDARHRARPFWWAAGVVQALLVFKIGQGRWTGVPAVLAGDYIIVPTDQDIYPTVISSSLSPLHNRNRCALIRLSIVRTNLHDSVRRDSLGITSKREQPKCAIFSNWELPRCWRSCP